MKLIAAKNVAEKNAAGLCGTPHCRNRRRKHKRFCNTCRSRAYTSPLLRKWLNLKISARRKGREFALTWEFFRELAEATGYALNSGREAFCLHIDRIDPLRGYLPDNVRVITAHENCRKAYVDRLRWAGVQFHDPDFEPF